MPQTPPINRLILIGNGFDLAHNMNTSYLDFIFWYLEESLNSAGSSRPYKDVFLSIEYMDRSTDLPGIKTLTDYVEYFCQVGFKEMTKPVLKFKGYLNDFHNPFKVAFPSAFFLRLLDRCSQVRWVDIENEYYSFLKEVSFSNSDKTQQVITDLNEKFSYLIILLERYISSLPQPQSQLEYEKIFLCPFRKNEFHGFKSMPMALSPNETCVLNFNYTSTPEQYFTKNTKRNGEDLVDINYIHGQCNDPNNPLIFGFGDELDKDYEKLESHSAKDLFSYFKAFWYFKTSNYYNLIRFIDSADYQVYILGHSCGLSDRTMLNMIFEHQNCKSIKIFYHEEDGKNNFTQTTQEISRHFKDKQRMRKLIVSFDKSSPMPQVKKDDQDSE